MACCRATCKFPGCRLAVFTSISLGLFYWVLLWSNRQASLVSTVRNIVVLRRPVYGSAGESSIQPKHSFRDTAAAWPFTLLNTTSNASQSKQSLPESVAAGLVNTTTKMAIATFSSDKDHHDTSIPASDSSTTAGTLPGNRSTAPGTLPGNSSLSPTSTPSSNRLNGFHNRSSSHSSSNHSSSSVSAANVTEYAEAAGSQPHRDDNEPTRASPTQHRLPKIILQTVPSKTNISCEVLDYMKEWRVKNPGYKHYVFDDDDCLTFMKRFHPELLSKYQSLSKVERTDLWRYLAVYQFGGVYADSDVRCITPIDQWNADHGFDAKVLQGIEDRTDQPGTEPAQFLQWTLAAVPKQTLFYDMAHFVRYYSASPLPSTASQQEVNAMVVDRTGPKGWSRVVHGYLQARGFPSDTLNQLSPTSVKVGTVRVLPATFLGRGCDRINQQELPYACHQFHGSWKGSEWPEHWRPKQTFHCPVPSNFLEPLDSLLALAEEAQ